MASWVLSIDKEHPQHWDYAQEHGFWDLRTKRAIQKGDIVYFWQSGASFAGRVMATTDVYEIQPGMPDGPWDDWPGPYRSRFDFVVLGAGPVSTPRWGEVLAQVSVKQGPNWAPRYTNPDDEAVPASYFTAVPIDPPSPLERALEAVLDESDEKGPSQADLDAMEEDDRKVVETMMVMREGQQAFRNKLMSAYRNACAVTGTSVPRALDAAHISDYKGRHTQEVSNGLLLRTDLHRLFDAKLITVTPDLVLHVSPDLWGSPYHEMDGIEITVPTSPAKRPDAALLKKHNDQCAWLST